jgi:hypothetical protein
MRNICFGENPSSLLDNFWNEPSRSPRLSNSCAPAARGVPYTLSWGSITTMTNFYSDSVPLSEQHFRTNQRAAVRFELHAEVTFCWLDESGVSRYGDGRTLDISTKGVYVVSATWPPRGASVAMNIDIPWSTSQSRFLQVAVEGRVVRIQPISNARHRSGFSVRNDRLLAITD